MHPSIADYLEHLTAQGRSPHTLKAARTDLSRFVAWWETSRSRAFEPVLVRHEDLRDWRADRQRHDGAAPATINRGLASLRGYCSWATKQGLMPDDPALEVGIVPSPELSPRSLPREAVDALLRAVRMTRDPVLRSRDEALLALLVYAGLRVQEACDVQLRDLDIPGGTVIVRSGKAGKARRVPLHPDAGRLLRRYLDSVRCPRGMPAVGSQEERERLLVGIAANAPGRPLRPGIDQRAAQRTLSRLGREAAVALTNEAARTSDQRTSAPTTPARQNPRTHPPAAASLARMLSHTRAILRQLRPPQRHPYHSIGGAFQCLRPSSSMKPTRTSVGS